MMLLLSCFVNVIKSVPAAEMWSDDHPSMRLLLGCNFVSFHFFSRWVLLQLLREAAEKG